MRSAVLQNYFGAHNTKQMFCVCVSFFSVWPFPVSLAKSHSDTHAHILIIRDITSNLLESRFGPCLLPIRSVSDLLTRKQLERFSVQSSIIHSYTKIFVRAASSPPDVAAAAAAVVAPKSRSGRVFVCIAHSITQM